MDQQLSKIIYSLRFPLVVMIVMTHADFESISVGKVCYVFELQDFPYFLNVSNLISRILVRLAVPLYFIISGYLFFQSLPKGTYTKEEYFIKLKKRTKSLLVPYAFWNLEVVFLFFVAQSFVPSMMSGNNELIKNYSISDWIMAFWTPICGQFWYIRDLFIIVILSPLLYIIIHKLHFAFIGMLGVLWILGVLMTLSVSAQHHSSSSHLEHSFQ